MTTESNLAHHARSQLAAIETISPVTLKDMPDEEVLSLHRRMHQLWGKNFAGNRQERAGQLVREDVWNAHEMITEEMGRRGMEHDSPLDSRSEQAVHHLPAMITVVPQFVSIVGSTAAVGPDPERDVDILIRAERQDGKFLIFSDNIDLPLRKAFDPQKEMEGRLHVISNPQGPHAENIPLYDLVLSRPTSNTLEFSSQPNNSSSLTINLAYYAGQVWIDLGCGKNKPPGYIGIDIKQSPFSDADIIYDLEQGLPFPDNYADQIRAYHVLEHLSKPVFIMYEIWRVLKPGGRFDFEVPSTQGEGAFAHPDHKSFWNATSFLFYTNRDLADEIGFPGLFDVVTLDRWSTDDGLHHYVTGSLRSAGGDPAIAAQLSVSPWYTGSLPKPAIKFFTEFFSVAELWDRWAAKRINDGLMVEEKLNGLRCLLQKKANQVRLTLSDEDRKDHAGKLPDLVAAAKKIDGDFILDGDLGVVETGKRWPRPRLMTLMATKPDLPENAQVVFTAFDILYHNDNLTSHPLSERRPALEKLIREADSPLLAISQGTSVRSRQQLEEAGRRFASRDMSEGIVVKELDAKYPLSPITNSWSKAKLAVEIKALVLEVKKTKSGAHNFRGGLLPGNSDHPNLREHAGTQYVDLGFSFNAPFAARAGDIVTFQIQEIILQDNGELAWLGAKPLDVDHDRKEPYTAPQVIDLARRGRILQDARKGRKQLAITEDLRRQLEAEAEGKIYAALQSQWQTLQPQLPGPEASPSDWSAFLSSLSDVLSNSIQELSDAVAETLQAAADAALAAAQEDRPGIRNTDTSAWAILTATLIILKILATTIAKITWAIMRYLVDGDYEALQRRLEAVFGRDRAARIAHTEVTRGLAFGYAGTTGDQLSTRPPLHPDCRCWLFYRPVDPLDDSAGYDVLWITADDDRVCERCAPLHQKVVGFATDIWDFEQEALAHHARHAKEPEGEGETRGERAAKFWEDHWHESFPKTGKGDLVYQHHWRGLSEEESKQSEDELLETDHSVHGDLRLSFGPALWGLTCFLGTTADARKRDLPNLPTDDALEGKFKLHQPKSWLTIARKTPFVAEPGGIGSTSRKYSKFFEIDHGTYQVGVWHKHFFEIFLRGTKIRGRYMIQYAQRPDGRRYWQIVKPKDQTPFADKHDKEQVIEERKKKGDRWLVWAKPGQKPELIDLKEAG